MSTEVKINPWSCISLAIKFSLCHVHAGARKQVDSLSAANCEAENRFFRF